MSLTPAEVLARELTLALPIPLPENLGIAVSGGGDSMALLVLLSDWCRENGLGLLVATVDHGLRSEAAEEAAFVASACERLGCAHTVLSSCGWDGQGNLQAEARSLRYDLISRWAHTVGVDHVCVAHTMDDQAETVLMRLARGSGVDGLSSMSASRSHLNITWLRPLLLLRRSDLRQELRRRNVSWVEDPSNADPQFDRIKARALLADPPLNGLDVPNLADTAARLTAARRVLANVAADAVDGSTRVRNGAIEICAHEFTALEDETRWRVLAAALCQVSGSVYRPRFKSLLRVEQDLLAGKKCSLHGCLLEPDGEKLAVFREPAAVFGLELLEPGRFDNWMVSGPKFEDGHSLRVVGSSGLAARPHWRDAGIARTALLSMPAIWKGSDLVSFPMLDEGSAWHSELMWDKAAFTARVLSH